MPVALMPTLTLCKPGREGTPMDSNQGPVFGISFLLVLKGEEKSFGASKSLHFLVHFHPVLFIINTIPNFDNWLILVAMLASILATHVKNSTLPLLLKGEKKREFLEQFLVNVQYDA